MSQLKKVRIPDFKTVSGKIQDISVSYQIFGRELHTAPIILITHALTGNSNVTSWWPQLVGLGKVIDLDRYTVLAFDIPGNGYSEEVDELIFNYQDWNLKDVGYAFAKAINTLNISTIDLALGGSIGGAVLWELITIAPSLIKSIVPIAADWKSTLWLQACCHVQQTILENSDKPIETARQHAMTLYRSPAGINQKFEKDAGTVQAWLNYHGLALQERFTLPAYRHLNHLLSQFDVTNGSNDIESIAVKSKASIDIICINSDGFFLAEEDIATYERIKNKVPSSLNIIQSVHGHDAFLIEHDQLINILKRIVKKRVKLHLVSETKALA